MEQDGSVFISHTSCDKCGSSDAKAEYSNGSSYCFSCKHSERGGNSTYRRPRVAAGLLENLEPIDRTLRGITQETFQKFGYRYGKLGEETVQVAPYYRNGEMVAQKVRTRDKQFRILGDSKNLPLFGMNLWPSGGKKIVITEGEIDAMSASQAQSNKWPVVSVPGGAQSAKKVLAQHIEYLEKFEEIILMFDMDEPGQAATSECIPLFTPGKAKVATLPVKDANELLKANRAADIVSAIWNAKAPTYEGVYSGEDVVDMPMTRYEITTHWPWPTMDNWTYGMREHEMYAYGAGSGVGKTDTLRSVMASLVEQGHKVGTILLEEPDIALTLTTIAGKVDHCLYHIPGDHIDEAKMNETKRRIAPYLFMYKTNGDLEIDSTISLIRYLVVACGCRHIFLDHVTAVLDGYVGDPLQGMKLFMKALNDINKELPFTLHYVSHLRKSGTGGKTHEEAGRVTLDDFAGGKAVIQYANFVFGIERNQQAESEEDRDTSLIRCLKDRFTGQAVGRTLDLQYDRKTGIKHEVTPFDDNNSGDSTPEF